MEGERRAQAKRSSHEEEKKGFSVLSNTRLGIEGDVQRSMRCESGVDGGQFADGRAAERPTPERAMCQTLEQLLRMRGRAGADMRANDESTNCAGSAVAGSESSRRWMRCWSCELRC